MFKQTALFIEERMNHFRVCKVPSAAQAVEAGVAWVSDSNRHWSGKNVAILGAPFVVKTSKYLAAGDVALNAADRAQLRLDLGTVVDMLDMVVVLPTLDPPQMN